MFVNLLIQIACIHKVQTSFYKIYLGFVEFYIIQTVFNDKQIKARNKSMFIFMNFTIEDI